MPERLLMTTDAVGGVWSFTVELVRQLACEGVEVAVATMGPLPRKDQVAELASVNGVRLFQSSHVLEWMDDPWADVERAGDWLLGIAEEFQPSMVHLNGYVHASLPWQRPVLITAHSCVLTWWRAVKNVRPPARWDEYRERVMDGLQAADLVVSPTTAFLQILEEEYGQLPSTRVVANGRRAELFRAARKESFILSAGRIWDEAKNLRLLDEIAPQVDFPIQIAGNRATGADGSFHHLQSLGHLTTNSLAEALSRAAIYAAPAFYEPFGLGVLEAALSECALVLSDIPTLRELWDGAAIFVSPDDPEAWIEQLNLLSQNVEDREQWSALALRRGISFGMNATAAGYLALYGELLQENLTEAAL